MAGLIHAYAGRTVLALGAHPDDVEISAGGTVARLVDGGARVVMAVAAVPADLDVRLVEARRAAEILGAELEVIHADRPRRVEDIPMSQLVRGFDDLVRRHEPAAVLVHSAEELHWDHLLVNRAALSAMRLRPMDLYFYAPTTCRPALSKWQPRIWVDIGATLGRKLEAIAAHQSQFEGRGLCVSAFQEQAKARGFQLGLEYAEGLDVYCARS